MICKESVVQRAVKVMILVLTVSMVMLAVKGVSSFMVSIVLLAVKGRSVIVAPIIEK